MKILHITHNLRGGAGKNLLRHHQSLLDTGVESRILVGEKVRASSSVQSLSFPRGRKRYRDACGGKLELLLGDNPLLNNGLRRLEDHPWVKWADVVELRQIHGGGMPPWLPLSEIRNLGNFRPLIWRLSDMWALTGYCAYSFECDRWKRSCGRCPQLREADRSRAELRAPKWDSSRFQLARKRFNYGSTPMTVVSPSRWLDSIVQQSFLGEHKRRVIPIGVDAMIYERSRAKCRKKLGLDANALALLAVFPNPGNYRKGYDLAMKVINRLKDKMENSVLVTVSKKPIAASACSFPIIEAGFHEDDESMAEVYRACDILIFPSRVDNSSQVLVEAGISGLAIAAFDVGGNSEYISESCRGFMAKPEDVEGMRGAISEMTADSARLRRIQESTRREVSERFALENQTQAFCHLYREVC